MLVLLEPRIPPSRLQLDLLLLAHDEGHRADDCGHHDREEDPDVNDAPVYKIISIGKSGLCIGRGLQFVAGYDLVTN